jgi:hypothetical protein
MSLAAIYLDRGGQQWFEEAISEYETVLRAQSQLGACVLMEPTPDISGTQCVAYQCGAVATAS